MKQTKNHRPSESVLLNEVQLLLAEKRTYYSVLRTGFAVITVPLTVIIFLLATKDYHKLFANRLTAISINLILVAIVVAGIIMSLIAIRKIRKINSVAMGIEAEDKRINKIIV